MPTARVALVVEERVDLDEHSAELLPGGAVIIDGEDDQMLLATLFDRIHLDPERMSDIQGATVLDNVDRIAALELDGDGFLLIAEGFFAPRLIVLDAETGQLVDVLNLSLPPFSIAIMTRGL